MGNLQKRWFSTMTNVQRTTEVWCYAILRLVIRLMHLHIIREYKWQPSFPFSLSCTC